MKTLSENSVEIRESGVYLLGDISIVIEDYEWLSFVESDLFTNGKFAAALTCNDSLYHLVEHAEKMQMYEISSLTHSIGLIKYNNQPIDNDLVVKVNLLKGDVFSTFKGNFNVIRDGICIIAIDTTINAQEPKCPISGMTLTESFDISRTLAESIADADYSKFKLVEA